MNLYVFYLQKDNNSTKIKGIMKYERKEKKQCMKQKL